MANPQPDKFTKISNEVINKFCCYRLSGQEWQVLWVILRKTWGWGKKMDKISHSQFAKMTGISRRHIWQIIQGLIEKDLVVKGITQKGDSIIVSYGIQKNYDKWKVSPKRVTITKKGDTLSRKKVTDLSRKKVHTINNLKDTYIKDNTAQIENLLGLFSPPLQQTIQTYFIRVASKNKSGVITDGRKITLLTELYNSYQRCNDLKLFTYALENAISYDAPNIGYIDAIIRNKKTARPR